ncbi:MAG: FkbM family methyltransferase [Anaerolineaceae bacterium]
MARNRYSQKENKNLTFDKSALKPVTMPFFNNGFCRGKETRHGFMLYNPNDFLGQTLEKYGEWGYSEIDILKQLIKPGFVILDVGANIGTHTLSFASLTGEVGFVYAFEPQRLLFEFLCANIALNNLLNVFPIMAGISDTQGEIIVPLVNPYTQANAGAINIEGHASGDSVRLMTIDSLQLARCNLIKVDVEGMERKVLLGARQTINQHRPLLFVENNTPENSAKLLELLFELKYNCWWFFTEYVNKEDIQGRPFKPGEGFKPDYNLLCIPVENSINVTGFQPVLGSDDTGEKAIGRIITEKKQTG